MKHPSNASPVKYSIKQIMGVEPTPSAWEADVLPIYYIRIGIIIAQSKIFYKMFFLFFHLIFRVMIAVIFPHTPEKYKISNNYSRPQPIKSDDPAPACGILPDAAVYAHYAPPAQSFL